MVIKSRIVCLAVARVLAPTIWDSLVNKWASFDIASWTLHLADESFDEWF